MINYRFSLPKDHAKNYVKSGETHPSRFQWVERQRAGSGEWERVGYVEIHTHRVKMDETDVEDISVGVTVRINPKDYSRVVDTTDADCETH